MKSRTKRFLNEKKWIIFFTIILLVSVCFCGAIVRAKNTKEKTPFYKYYTSIQIRPGDTLWGIASQYCQDAGEIRDYMEELKRINRLSGEKIHAGRYLTVMYYSEEYK